MRAFTNLLSEASESAFKLKLLNVILALKIPFNARHGFKVLALGKDSVTTGAKYLRRNMNHIKGIHACAIATIAEFSAGLVLMRAFDFKKYRLIMSHLEATYHYQAKQSLRAVAQLTDEKCQKIIHSLSTQDSLTTKIISEIYDAGDHHVATVQTTWQLKSWAKVRTKL
jgi:acyl-coenzyme A thioesterase PaaI-like protein